MKIITPKQTIDNKLSKYQLIIETTPALTGTEDGVVSVPNRPGYIYVRDVATGNTIQVWNSIAPLVKDLSVQIGVKSGRLQVLEVRDVYYNYLPALVASHKNSHEYGVYGSDVVNVHPEQFMAWYAYKSTLDDFTVVINRQVINASGVWVNEGSEDIDLNAHIPASGTDALYVLISVDEDGVLQHTVGTPVADPLSLTLDDIPGIQVGSTPLWAIRLYVGQTVLVWADDFVDLRWVVKRDSGVRTYTWVVGSLSTGGVPGPQLAELHTVERVNAYTLAGTSVTFNIEERAVIGTPGTDIMTSDLVADVDGAQDASPANASLAANTWLWVDISNISGSPDKVIITLRCRV